MESQEFYGVYGYNGAGIYTDCYDALAGRRDVDSFKIKKFNEIQDAVDYVVEGLVVDYGVLPFSELDQSVLWKELNWFHWLDELFL